VHLSCLIYLFPPSSATVPQGGVQAAVVAGVGEEGGAPLLETDHQADPDRLDMVNAGGFDDQE